ncbi:MAG: M15 family metallopeptidase [Candidatus Saccharimonadaceae bacterium]
MATSLKDKPSKTPNPGDRHANRLFPDGSSYIPSDLDDAEHDQAADTTDDNDESIGDQEQTASSNRSGSWNDNYTANQNGNGSGKGKSRLQKNAPLGVLLAFIIAAAGVIGFFGGPSMLILDIAERMTDRFNYQLTSMDARTNKLLDAKFKNTTKGCSSLSPVVCKYSTLGEKTIKNMKELKQKGIDLDLEVNTVKGSGLSSNRYTIKSIKWQGKEISSKDFAKFSRENPKFADAMRRVYNPKFVGLADTISAKVRGILKAPKSAPFSADDDTDEKKLKKVSDITAEGRTDLTPDIKKSQVDPNCQQNCDAPADENTSKLVKDLNDMAGESGSSGTRQTTNALAGMLKNGLGNLASVVKVGGIVDNACTVLGMFRAVGLGAKLIRNNQAARFAMIFLTTASMIRASTDASAKGDLTPEVTSFVGDMLTTTYTNSDGSQTKSATDSSGYGYAARGDTDVNDNASQYLAGAGLGGQLSGAMDMVLNVIGGINVAKTVCAINNNPIVQIGSFAAGVGLLLIPGGQAVSIGKWAGQAAFAAGTFAAQVMLPAILSDIVAGKLIDNRTAGESAGNIITVGSGHMLGQTSKFGFNAILRPKQARSVLANQQEVLARYAEDDRRTYSPLDPTNQNTFMGNIRGQLVPILNSSSSNNLASVTSRLFGSLSNLIPSAKAANQQTYIECQDTDYRQIDLATDPLCNPIYGIPPEYLTRDTVELFYDLKARGYIDDNGTPQQIYTDYLNACVNRELPFGSTGEDSLSTDGSECYIDDQAEADLYIYMIDQRVLTTMEGEDPVLEGQTSAAATVDTSGAIGPPQSERQPNNWGGHRNGEIPTSALHSISQPPSATDMTTIKTFLTTYLGRPVADADIKTSFSGCTVEPYSAAGEPQVGSQPFVHPKAFVSLVALNAAYRDKFNRDMQLVSCYRDIKGQESAKEYWTKRGKPGNAADPGTSNHGWGLAVDIGPGNTGNGFRYSTKEYVWMMANAPKFGWINPKNMQQGGSGPEEPWHWEYARGV